MENKNSFLGLPGAIIIAGAIIAIAIIWVKKPVDNNSIKSNQIQQQSENEIVDLSPIANYDHVLGNPEAPVKIIEYSDPSCPYCKVFNSTMFEIMDQFGPSGKVAWIYRSYPLDKPDQSGNILHPNAGFESKALECAASIGNNEIFWKYEKLFYETTPGVTAKTPDGLDRKQLPIMATKVGLDRSAFEDCLSGDENKSRVEAQFESGLKAGVTGTPTNFIVLDNSINKTATQYIENALIQYRIPEDLLRVTNNGKVIVMAGAMPKTLIVGLLNTLIGR